MYTFEKLKSALDALNTERELITSEGWYLQDCWLQQIKPGGSARTNREYWQVRSYQPMFNGKKLKHLKSEEVDDYKAAIQRGRQLKQIDRQIKKLQKKLEQNAATPHIAPLQVPAFTTDNLQQSQAQPETRASQDHLVNEVLTASQALRASLRQSMTRHNTLIKISWTNFIDLRAETSLLRLNMNKVCQIPTVASSQPISEEECSSE